MSFTIRLEPSGHEFSVEPDETILAAAQRQGLSLPYSCRSGECGSCKARLLAGRVDYGDYQEKALSAAEKADGLALLCQARALDDVTFQVREVSRVGDFPVRTLPCRVAMLERAAPDVMITRLLPPQNERLRYLAGQYIDILLRDGSRRSFSIANPPGRDDFLELHIRHVPGGAFTTHVFEKLKEKDLLRFQGPLGTFFLRDEAGPALLVAGGTGFAPMQAMIEQAFASGTRRSLTLYWGARARQDLYRQEQALRWALDHPSFRYVPVLTQPLPGDNWTGRTGYVHEAVLADHPDLAPFEVYAGGPPAMVEAIRQSFPARGLDPQRLYYDSFEYAHAR